MRPLNNKKIAQLKRCTHLIQGALLLAPLGVESDEEIAFKMILSLCNPFNSDKKKSHIVSKWRSTVGKIERDRIHINQSRFMKLMKSDEWDTFIYRFKEGILVCDHGEGCTKQSIKDMVHDFAIDMEKKENGEWPIPADKSWSLKYINLFYNSEKNYG